MLITKGHHDFGSAHFNQALVESMLLAGAYAPHLQTVRQHYAAKSARLCDALESGGLKALGWDWEVPQGGLILWLRAPVGMDLGCKVHSVHAVLNRESCTCQGICVLRGRIHGIVLGWHLAPCRWRP